VKLHVNALKLPPTVLHDQANACLAQLALQCAVARPSPVQVDASELVQFDSSALAVLLGLRRLVAAQGGRLQVVGMTAHLRSLASLYGVLALLEPT
jgi:phospholipid transport system transporter-binding protein